MADGTKQGLYRAAEALALRTVSPVRMTVLSDFEATLESEEARRGAFQPPCADFGHFSPGVPDSLHIAAYPCVSAAMRLHIERALSPANSLLMTAF